MPQKNAEYACKKMFQSMPRVTLERFHIFVAKTITLELEEISSCLSMRTVQLANSFSSLRGHLETDLMQKNMPSWIKRTKWTLWRVKERLSRQYNYWEQTCNLYLHLKKVKSISRMSSKVKSSFNYFQL